MAMTWAEEWRDIATFNTSVEKYHDFILEAARKFVRTDAYGEESAWMGLTLPNDVVVDVDVFADGDIYKASVYRLVEDDDGFLTWDQKTFIELGRLKDAQYDYTFEDTYEQEGN